MPTDSATARHPARTVLANLACLGVLAAGTPPFVFLVGTSLDGRRSSVLASFAIEAAIVLFGLLPAVVRGLPRLHRELLVRRSRSLAIAVAVNALALAAFAVPAAAPRVAPLLANPAIEVGSVGPRMMAYGLGWLPAARRILVTHTHDPNGRGYTILDAGTGTVVGEAPYPALNYKPPTIVPRLDLAIVPETITESGPPALTHFVNLATGSEWNRPANDVVVFRATYDPRIDRLYVLDKANLRLYRMSPDEFVAGEFARATTWDMDPILSFEEVELDPNDVDRVFVRGDVSTRVATLDTTTGELRFLRVVLGVWDLSADGARRRLYASRSYAGTLAVIDTESFRVVRDVWVGGVPRVVAYLPGVDLIAVGLFTGARLVFLDPDDFAVKARIATCAQVRDAVFDAPSRELYFSDACGVHRVRFDGGSEPARSTLPATPPMLAGEEEATR